MKLKEKRINSGFFPRCCGQNIFKEGLFLNKKDVETITTEMLTRFYLQNHFLLQQVKKDKFVNVVGNVCGLHSQLPLTPYFMLWNRIEDFEPEMLDDALYREKSLVKTWFIRGTLHVIPSEDLPVYHHALKRMWFEHHGRYMNKPDWPSREEREKLFYPKIQMALAEKPLRRKELNDKVRLLLGGKSQPYARIFSAWGGILKETSYLGLTVHGEPCGKESCFARLDKWLPQINLGEVTEDEAIGELLLKYLQCYGPASVQDFACWSGLLASEANKTIEKNQKELKEVQLQGSGKRLWMLKKDFKALQKIDLEEKAPTRLLPKYDSYLMGYKGRTRIIKEELLKQVYRPVVGDVAATLIVNGRIAGTWTCKKSKKKITVAIRAFEKLSKETMTEVEQVAKALGDFMGVEQTTVLLNSK
jgi:hypothetical protein